MTQITAQSSWSLPPRQGLYDPRFEHDACGIGFVALLVFLGWPLYLAATNISKISAGVLVPLAFSVNSLSDVPFEHQGVLYLYTLSLVFIWFSHEFKKDTCTS